MARKLTPAEKEEQKIKLKIQGRAAKAKIKERIRNSNALQAMGLPADPWVIEYRAKRRAETKRWMEKTGYKEPKRSPKPLKPREEWAKTGRKRVRTPEQIKEYKKKWERNNRERLNEMRRKKRQTDIGFKIACNLRKRLSFLLRLHLAKKSKQTLSLLGCDIRFFMDYLAEKFQDGMSFENYGEWHLDHIFPCDKFDLTDPEQQAKCFHYTNIQPLWGPDNRAKSNKIPFNCLSN